MLSLPPWPSNVSFSFALVPHYPLSVLNHSVLLFVAKNLGPLKSHEPCHLQHPDPHSVPQKEPFETLEPGKVKMYCCGVTVYDYSHLGHARCYIVWDTVRRYLMWRGYDVHYVQNFTDIDDKILNRAKAEGSSMQTVADKFTAAYFEDMARLNVMEADEYTYATKTLDGIQRLISELEAKATPTPPMGMCTTPSASSTATANSRAASWKICRRGPAVG
jgi:hypothetical protein